MGQILTLPVLGVCLFQFDVGLLDNREVFQIFANQNVNDYVGTQHTVLLSVQLLFKMVINMIHYFYSFMCACVDCNASCK